jgi:hypothetical protein
MGWPDDGATPSGPNCSSAKSNGTAPHSPIAVNQASPKCAAIIDVLQYLAIIIAKHPGDSN